MILYRNHIYTHINKFVHIFIILYLAEVWTHFSIWNHGWNFTTVFQYFDIETICKVNRFFFSYILAKWKVFIMETLVQQNLVGFDNSTPVSSRLYFRSFLCKLNLLLLTAFSKFRRIDSYVNFTSHCVKILLIPNTDSINSSNKFDENCEKNIPTEKLISSWTGRRAYNKNNFQVFYFSKNGFKIVSVHILWSNILLMW